MAMTGIISFLFDCFCSYQSVFKLMFSLLYFKSQRKIFIIILKKKLYKSQIVASFASKSFLYQPVCLIHPLERKSTWPRHRLNPSYSQTLHHIVVGVFQIYAFQIYLFVPMSYFQIINEGCQGKIVSLPCLSLPCQVSISGTTFSVSSQLFLYSGSLN